MSFRFENLLIWQRSLDVASEIHGLTKSFPKDELYVLSSQMKRAADSISLNIAEGCTGQSDKEFGRFLGIALRSGVELVGCLYLAKRRDLIDQTQFETHYSQILELTKMIQSFRKTLNSPKRPKAED